MAYNITPIDYSIKLAITASIKRFEFKRYNVDPDQVVDALLSDIFTDLFPHNPSLVSPDNVPLVQLPVILPSSTTTTTTTTNQRKKPGPKPKVPAPEEGSIAVTSTTAPEKKKPGPKPKTDAPQNIKKLNPTQIKKLEKASPGADIKQFIDYLNALTPEAFKDKVIDDHIQDFLNPGKEEATEEGYSNTDCIEVEFNGNSYFVNTTTKAVYKTDNEHVNVKVGRVGALEFADMEIPEDA